LYRAMPLLWRYAGTVKAEVQVEIAVPGVLLPQCCQV